MLFKQNMDIHFFKFTWIKIQRRRLSAHEKVVSISLGRITLSNLWNSSYHENINYFPVCQCL